MLVHLKHHAALGAFVAIIMKGLQKLQHLLDNLTDWIIPTINEDDASCYCVPLSPFNFTFVFNSRCLLKQGDIFWNIDVFENSTKYFFSQLYDYYFGSAGRAKFCDMSLQLEKWNLLLPEDLSTATAGRTRKHNTHYDYQQHRETTYNISEIAQPWQFFFRGEACFKYNPPPNETLREAILESFLSLPQILSKVGDYIYQPLLPLCGNQSSSFEVVTPYGLYSSPLVSSTSSQHDSENSNSLKVKPLGGNELPTPSNGTSTNEVDSIFNDPIFDPGHFSSNPQVANTTTPSTGAGSPSNNEGSDTTAVTSQSADSKNNTALIVGIAVPLFLLVASIIAVIIVRKRKYANKVSGRRNLEEIYDVSKIDYGMNNADYDRATSIVDSDADEVVFEGSDRIAEGNYNEEVHESYQQQLPTTTSLLAPRPSTTAAVLLASKVPENKRHLADFDICAKSAITEDDVSLVVSVPLEEVLNVNTHTGTTQYINQSSQMDELMRSYRIGSAVAADDTLETSKNSATSCSAAAPIVAAAGSIPPAVKKSVSFSEPEKEVQDQKQKTSPISALFLLSPSHNSDESSRRLTQPSRYVEEPDYEAATKGQKYDYQDSSRAISKKEANEGEISLAESSLCMSKKDLISLLAGSRIRKEEDYAVQKLFDTKQSFAKHGDQGFAFNN